MNSVFRLILATILIIISIVMVITRYALHVYNDTYNWIKNILNTIAVILIIIGSGLIVYTVAK